MVPKLLKLFHCHNKRIRNVVSFLCCHGYAIYILNTFCELMERLWKKHTYFNILCELDRSDKSFHLQFSLQDIFYGIFSNVLFLSIPILIQELYCYALIKKKSRNVLKWICVSRRLNNLRLDINLLL